MTAPACLGEGTLVDFDWSLRVVMSSQTLSSMRKPVLLLDLALRFADGSTKNQVVELNDQDLDDVLRRFQSVEGVLTQMGA